jgi:hypothetical protein
MSRRSPHRALAERLVREVLAAADTRGSSAREIRRQIRAAFAPTTITSAVRYAAVRAVTGAGLLDLRPARQPSLLDRGPRRIRSRKKPDAR